MLTPATFPLFLRHFDSIDYVVAERASWDWDENSLTRLLCDLFDETRQPAYRLDYPLPDLLADLSRAAPLAGVTVTVQAHKHDTNLESWVSQADLGLVLEVVESVAPGRTFSYAVLLQAKRLYPWPNAAGRHEERSVFGGYDADQEERIERLRGVLGQDSVQHLLYCPRGASLPQPAPHRLAHLRAAAVTDDIFDFTIGHAKLQALRSSPEAFDAGVFVAADITKRTKLSDLHAGVFEAATPLSWFIAQALMGRRETARGRGAAATASRQREDLIRGLVEGRPDAIDRIREALDLGDRRFAVAPGHTITVTLRVSEEQVLPPLS